uniref:Uncharacterized protein n=1 Tax=Macrostomum lignano TaxID=282301 RepID=A0A1I8JJV5_9PLAT
MPKRQECALTISSEHSDLAAASVIWFTCCSQAAAAAAAIRAGNSEVSHASDMPKRQECALTISSEHSDLAAASVIWFTCCSQAAAAAAAIRAGNSEVSHASDMPKRQECALTISSEHSDLAAASVIWFTCCSQAAAAAAAIRAGNSEVSHASDMPKRQECALTISSEHSDLAAASVIWFTCCSQAAAAAAAIRAGNSEVSHASDMPKRQECALTISSEHSDLAAASVIWFTCCSQAAAAAAAIRAGNSEVSHASDMPKRQECALTISSEHSDLAAASVIWFTCCSQAAAAAAAIRAGNSEVSHASDMPKRQECALTISSEHSDLAAASVIWFTCCSQAAAAAAAIRAGNSEVSHASDMPKRQECALTISSEHSDLAAASVIWFTCCSQAAAAAAAAIRAGNSEVSHASDMPKRQECALTISSEHSDLAAASVIWFTCCSQAAAAAAAAIRAGTSILISPLHPSFGSLAAHKPQQQQPLSVQAVSLFVNFLVDLKKTRPAQD